MQNTFYDDAEVAEILQSIDEEHVVKIGHAYVLFRGGCWYVSEDSEPEGVRPLSLTEAVQAVVGGQAVINTHAARS